MADTTTNNSDIVQMMPGNDQTPPMYSVVNGDSIVDRDSAGRIQSIKLDITKAQNTFVDLRQVFNANQVDGKVIMPVSLYRYGNAINLAGWTGEIHGLYPDKTTTFILNTAGGNTGTIYNFLWDTGVFQTTGKYTFQFVFTNSTTGETVSSKWCFFEVEPDILSMAVNFPNGIEPYDNEYQSWKSNVETDISQLHTSLKTITDTATQTLGVLQNYESNAQGYVDTAWTNKLAGENTWTGEQHLSTADIASANIQKSAVLPNNTKITSPALKNVGNDINRGFFTLEAEYNANTDTSQNTNGASFLNGVTPGAGGQHYMSFRVFRCQIPDGSTRTIMEIHANCAFPSGIEGKSIVQFPSNASMWDGIDQTPFILGKWIVEFTKNSSTLNVLSKVNTSDSDQNCLDARMV